MVDRDDTIQVLYGKEASWVEKDMVLKKGEHGFEWDTGRFKIGDGASLYSELEYFIPESRIQALIQAAIADLPASSGGGISVATFNAHVDSLTPHSVYDDGPSLLLLYQNAKV